MKSDAWHRITNSSREIIGKTAYTNKAEDYAAYRPPYAAAAIRALYESVGLDSNWVVADIGSGTGNVCRHLLERVATVFAVEPNDAMRHQAERLLGKLDGFVSIKGTAEDTTLPAKSVNLITVGQAFHWFDVEQAEREFDRILKVDGWLALIWNRFPEDTNPDLSTIFPNNTCKRLSFPLTLNENWQRFIGGARSVAHNPSRGEYGYKNFEWEQRKLFDAKAVKGLIEIKLTTELAVGQMNRRTTI